jgi:hypothetical protein
MTSTVIKCNSCTKSTFTKCTICNKSTLNNEKGISNLSLPCGCTYHDRCIKYVVYETQTESTKRCPLCKKYLISVLSDHFKFIYNGDFENLFKLAKLNSMFSFKNTTNYNNKITVDGYTYSNLHEQLINICSVGDITNHYGDINYLNGELISDSVQADSVIESFSNTINFMDIYLIKSTENPNKFILIDEYLRQLILSRKISDIDVYEGEDNLGNIYYTTVEEFPYNKYLKYVRSSGSMILASYLQILDMPYFGTDIMTKISSNIYDPEDNIMHNTDSICLFIGELTINTLHEYVKKDVQLNYDENYLVKIVSLASIFNTFSILGHNLFSFKKGILEELMGVNPEELTLKRSAPADTKEILLGTKKFALDDEVFKPLLMLEEKDFPILYQFIDEQKIYMDNNIEILV